LPFASSSLIDQVRYLFLKKLVQNIVHPTLWYFQRHRESSEDQTSRAAAYKQLSHNDWGVVLSTPQQLSEAAGGVDQLGQELAALSRQA
jgi:hypothetical protein